MQILRLPTVKSRAGHRSDASIYNAIRDGLWTKGVAIGQRAKGWPEHEVEAIIAARIAGCSDLEIRTLVSNLHRQRLEQLSALGIDCGAAMPKSHLVNVEVNRGMAG